MASLLSEGTYLANYIIGIVSLVVRFKKTELRNKKTERRLETIYATFGF